MSLRLCEGCARHVRVRETRCPFCDATLVAQPSARDALLEVPVRLGRSALAALAAGSILSACSSPAADPPAAPLSPVVVVAPPPAPVDFVPTPPPVNFVPAPPQPPPALPVPVPVQPVDRGRHRVVAPPDPVPQPIPMPAYGAAPPPDMVPGSS